MVEETFIGFIGSILKRGCEVFSVNRVTSRDVKRFMDIPKLRLILLVELGKIKDKRQVICGGGEEHIRRDIEFGSGVNCVGTKEIDDESGETVGGHERE